jgi:hypothetical protein
MRALCDLCQRFPCFAVVKEDFRIRTHARKVVPRWGILHILYEFRVGFYRLQTLNSQMVISNGYVKTFSYLKGTPTSWVKEVVCHRVSCAHQCGTRSTRHRLRWLPGKDAGVEWKRR